MCGDTEPPHKKIVQHSLCCWPAVQHLCGQVFAPDMQWHSDVCMHLYIQLHNTIPSSCRHTIQHICSQLLAPGMCVDAVSEELL